MLARWIELCARRRGFTALAVALLAVWGLWSLRTTPLDALPDLSDTQVIVFTEWMGRSPNLVEDQITYPIVTTFLAAPNGHPVLPTLYGCGPNMEATWVAISISGSAVIGTIDGSTGAVGSAAATTGGKQSEQNMLRSLTPCG